MTSKEALETVKDYLLPKLKEDNSELGSIIIVESVNVLEKLVDRDTPKNLVLKAGSFFNINIICPSCDFPINTERHELHSSTMFCERCGQKINLAQRV